MDALTAAMRRAPAVRGASAVDLGRPLGSLGLARLGHFALFREAGQAWWPRLLALALGNEEAAR